MSRLILLPYHIKVDIHRFTHSSSRVETSSKKLLANKLSTVSKLCLVTGQYLVEEIVTIPSPEPNRTEPNGKPISLQAKSNKILFSPYLGPIFKVDEAQEKLRLSEILCINALFDNNRTLLRTYHHPLPI